MTSKRKWRALIILIKTALLLQTGFCLWKNKIHTHERLVYFSKKELHESRPDVASNALPDRSSANTYLTTTPIEYTTTTKKKTFLDSPYCNLALDCFLKEIWKIHQHSEHLQVPPRYAEAAVSIAEFSHSKPSRNLFIKIK